MTKTVDSTRGEKLVEKGKFVKKLGNDLRFLEMNAQGKIISLIDFQLNSLSYLKKVQVGSDYFVKSVMGGNGLKAGERVAVTRIEEGT